MRSLLGMAGVKTQSTEQDRVGTWITTNDERLVAINSRITFTENGNTHGGQGATDGNPLMDKNTVRRQSPKQYNQ